MKIEKVESCDKPRIPLRWGEIKGKAFVFSVFTDGAGCLLEFDNDSYLLPVEQILEEILKDYNDRL